MRAQLAATVAVEEINRDTDEQHMLLKIDVEGAEWDVFDGMSSNLLSKFDQIVAESRERFSRMTAEDARSMNPAPTPPPRERH